MPPTDYRSRSSFSGASTPKTPWIARSHHRHMEMPAVPHFPNPLTSPPSTVPEAPAAPVVVRPRARGSTLRHRRHQVSRGMPTCTPHMVYLVKQPQCDLVCVHPPPFRPCSHMSVPPMWEHILCAWREPTMQSVQILVRQLVLFLNLGPWSHGYR